jgi:hypothetical protein
VAGELGANMGTKVIMSDPNYIGLAEEYEASTMSTSSKNCPADKYLDNLAG